MRPTGLKISVILLFFSVFTSSPSVALSSLQMSSPTYKLQLKSVNGISVPKGDAIVIKRVHDLIQVGNVKALLLQLLPSTTSTEKTRQRYHTWGNSHLKRGYRIGRIYMAEYTMAALWLPENSPSIVAILKVPHSRTLSLAAQALLRIVTLPGSSWRRPAMPQVH